MADRLVNREPQIRRVDHDVVIARRHRFGAKLRARLLAGLRGLLDQAGADDIIPAGAARRRQAVARRETAAGAVDGGRLKVRRDARAGLMNAAAKTIGEESLFAGRRKRG